MSVTGIAVVILVAIIGIGAIVILLLQRRRTHRLQSRFGPEYDRAIEQAGSRYRGEEDLERLERQVEQYSIRPLRPELAEHFQVSWSVIQAGFVDDPKISVAGAARLIEEVLSEIGYPAVDFEERAAEISVNHPFVVEHYRAGHDILLGHAKGPGSTEELRRALIHYRTLFDDLVGVPEKARTKAAGN